MTKRPAHIDDGLGIRMGEEILNAKAVRLFRRGSAALKFERGGPSRRPPGDKCESARLLWMRTVIDGAIHRQWLAEMGGADAHQRTAHLTCELFTRLDAVGRVRENSFELPLTQTYFGDTFGLNLGAEGIVSWEAGVVTVHDIERLKHTEFDPTYLNLPRASVDRPKIGAPDAPLKKES